MESANFHHHQQQDHQLIVDSSSFSWSQNPILNNGANNNITSRNLVTSTNSIVQDLFPYNGMGYPIESYPKFLELLNYNPTSNMEDLELHDLELQSYSSYLKNNVDHQQNSYTNDNQDFLFTNYITNGTFSQIFPNISVSSLKQSTTTSTSSSSTSSSSVSPSSFDMNCLPALDPFGYSFDRRMHQPNHTPSVCPSKISSTGSTYQSSKRPASKYVDAKETKPVATKKSKSEPRSSSAPFQVRKEKLGDRIAAIQQLVAPFGKTDTASVLMEAIGYIKFLQTQVETLSMPYMKSANEIGGMSLQPERMKDGNKGVKRDLRSRGLCLVPVSCLSYVTDGSEGFW